MVLLPVSVIRSMSFRYFLVMSTMMSVADTSIQLQVLEFFFDVDNGVCDRQLSVSIHFYCYLNGAHFILRVVPFFFFWF